MFVLAFIEELDFISICSCYLTSVGPQDSRIRVPGSRVATLSDARKKADATRCDCVVKVQGFRWEELIILVANRRRLSGGSDTYKRR